MRFAGVLILLLAPAAMSAELTVTLSPGETVHVANALERSSQVIKPGSPDGASAHFADLRTDAVYDLAIEEDSGNLLCGVDLSWCDATPQNADSEPLGDDDRVAITSIVTDIRGFANKPTILQLIGDRDRAVALVNLVRDNGFHSNSGDEIIWRAEVWFFRWENGGWERVANQSRLLRRERFASRDAFQKELARVRWIPELGGVHIAGDTTIQLKPTIQVRPSSQPVAATVSPPATKASGSTAATRPTELFGP